MILKPRLEGTSKDHQTLNKLEKTLTQGEESRISLSSVIIQVTEDQWIWLLSEEG